MFEIELFWHWNCTTRNGIVQNRSVRYLTECKQKTILLLNWIIWIRTAWINWKTWNRNVSDNWHVHLWFTEFFLIELFMCMKIDLALNNQQRLICHKTQTNKQTKKHFSFFFIMTMIFFFWYSEIIPYIELPQTQQKENIHRTHENEYPDMTLKTSDGEARVLEFWGIWSTLSLPFLQCLH